jgi:uncharacterized metal-binding protein YceD (DUF177 family)
MRVIKSRERISMRFHEPDWVGEVIRCDNCAVKFTLEAEDDVTLYYTYCDGSYQFQMKCPKCNKDILFDVNQKEKEQNVSPQKNDVYPKEEEMDLRSIRRMLSDS